MLNRILYWFITLPVLAKSGYLGVTVLLLAYTVGTIASIPATRARVAAQATQTAVAQREQATQTTVAQHMQATQVAVAQHEQATQVAIDTAATSSAQAAATVQANSNATATSIVAAQQATESAIAAATTTAQTAADATTAAIAIVATSAAASTAAAAPTPEPIAVAQIPYKELGRWEKDGDTWVTILIEPGMDHSTLTTLAKQLREQDVSARYHFIDDSAEFKQFQDWSINGGKVYDKDGVLKEVWNCVDIDYCVGLSKQGKEPYPYPEKWFSEHYIAMLNLMFQGGGNSEWQLMTEDGTLTVNIDVTTTAWGGTRKDGQVTEAEAVGWIKEYMQNAKGSVCCITDVQVVRLSNPRVVLTLEVSSPVGPQRPGDPLRLA